MRLFFALAFIFLTGIVSAGVEINPPIVSVLSNVGENASIQLALVSDQSEEYLLETYQNTEFFSIDKGYFDIDSNGQNLDIIFNRNLKEGVYSGKINLIGEESYQIPVVLEVESSSPVFDVITEKNYNSEGLDFSVKILKLKPGEDNVVVGYRILNLEGETLLFENEELEISNRVELKKSFAFEQEAGESYVFSVIATQGNSLGTSTVLFSQGKSQQTSFNFYFILLVVVLIISFIIVNLLWTRNSKKSKTYWEGKINRIKNSKTNNVRKMRRLSYQKEVLHRAYNAGYVTKESYKKSISQIEKTLRSLK